MDKRGRAVIKIKRMHVNYFLAGVNQGIIEAVLECRPRGSAYTGLADRAYKQGRAYGLEHAVDLLPAFKENRIMRELLCMEAVELV